MQIKPSFRLVFRCLLAFVLAIAIISFLPGRTVAEEKEELSDLWIDLSIGPPLLDLFNERAHAGDMARVEHISQLDLLKEIHTGKRLVVFKSAEDAIRLLPHIYDEIDIIGYNLEHGPTNPVNEQEDPIEYMKQLREAADEYDLELALGPDRAFALSHGSVLAPYADYLILQVQKVQTEPETVYDFVLPVLRGVRLANPDIQTSVQIRTEGDVDDLLDLLEPLQDEIDGISILTSEETIDVTQELMGELRALKVQPTRTPVEEDLPVDIEAISEGEEIAIENPLTATIVATSADNSSQVKIDDDSTSEMVAEIHEEIDEGISEETMSAPESNQRSGSTWLFVAIALIIGFALGAGYVSYRASS